MKILVADDDAISRRLMSKMLETCGYEVVTAADGEQAAQLLAAPDGPRLALIDWMMPKMDGPEVCRQVRKNPERSYVYFILLTSRQSKQDVIAGFESGADDYLTKPCNIEELKARLRAGQRILHLEDRLMEIQAELQYKATHDALTSLWNQGAILELLRRELFRAERELNSVSLMLCDVDYFKKINDQYGHLVGDKVLIEVAQRLQAVVRPYDAVGRYGGEEFLMVLTGCDDYEARARAEDIRKCICNRPFICDGREIPLSISLGVISHASREGKIFVEEILSMADAALYRAKAAGRNCVSFVEDKVMRSAMIEAE